MSFTCKYCTRTVKVLDGSECEQCEDVYPNNFYDQSRKPRKNNIKNVNRRRKIWTKTNGICYLCNAPVSFEEMTIDHFIPKSKGGTDQLTNLMPTHALCNNKKADTILAL